MPDLTPDENATSMQLVSEAIRAAMDGQRDGIERLETKATILLGFVVTIVPLYATQDVHHPALRWVAFAVYAVSAAAGLLASRPYRHKESPPPRAFASAFVAAPQPPASVSKWLIMGRVKAFEQNHATAKRKAGFTWVALVAFVIAAVFSVGSLLQ